MTITTTQPIIRENSVDKFNVKLNQFEGPFDLLLSLIAKHELEVTALSLHIVTDDFLQYIKNQGSEWDLDEATEFLVIAATLLDLKTARLLPSGEVEDEEDIARLEARDLLFARLMQYKAFKDVSFWLNDQLSIESKRFARSVSLEPQFANLLPEVLLGLGPNELARLAAKAMEKYISPLPPQPEVKGQVKPELEVDEDLANAVSEGKKSFVKSEQKRRSSAIMKQPVMQI